MIFSLLFLIFSIVQSVVIDVNYMSKKIFSLYYVEGFHKQHVITHEMPGFGKKEPLPAKDESIDVFAVLWRTCSFCSSSTQYS